MRKDGTKDFIILKFNELIATLSIRPNQAIEIIKDGKMFSLIDTSENLSPSQPPISFSRSRLISVRNLHLTRVSTIAISTSTSLFLMRSF